MWLKHIIQKIISVEEDLLFYFASIGVEEDLLFYFASKFPKYQLESERWHIQYFSKINYNNDSILKNSYCCTIIKSCWLNVLKKAIRSYCSCK